MTKQNFDKLISLLKDEGYPFEDFKNLSLKDFQKYAQKNFGKTLYDIIYGDISELPLHINNEGWRKTLALWRLSL